MIVILPISNDNNLRLTFVTSINNNFRLSLSITTTKQIGHLRKSTLILFDWDRLISVFLKYLSYKYHMYKLPTDRSVRTLNLLWSYQTPLLR